MLSDDFNKDGLPDLTVLCSQNFAGASGLSSGLTGVYQYAGRGNGTFAPPVLVNTGGGGGPGVYTDVNGDGVTDLVYDAYGFFAPGSTRGWPYGAAGARRWNLRGCDWLPSLSRGSTVCRQFPG